MRLFILLLMFGLSQARFAEPGHNLSIYFGESLLLNHLLRNICIQHIPNTPLRIFRKEWILFSKTVLELNKLYISTSFKNEISILSHIATKVTDSLISGKGSWLSHIQNTGRWNYSALVRTRDSIYLLGFYVLISLPSLNLCRTMPFKSDLWDANWSSALALIRNIRSF